MRKGLTTLLVILLAVGAVLVSCKAEVGTPADELVAVSFEEGSSRSITATLEGFDKNAYYWKYAAEKADDSGLTSGATESYDEDGAVAVSEGNKGLGSGTGTDYKPYKVPGFSQGLWNFKLWAYRDENYSDLLFYGEAQNVSLSRGGENTASVVVNPVSEGDGYIKIGEITFIPKKTGDETDQLKFIEVTNPDGSAVSGISYDTTTQTYTVPAGAYKVTVRFANASQTIVYAEGYVIATVYSGLETLIGGNLKELVTYAQFDADLNPDAVNVQAESAEIPYGDGDPVEIKTDSTAEKQVKTSVARSDANAIIEAMAEEQGVDTGLSTKLKLTLNVDPTEATETTVTYEIGMKATLTYTKDTETLTSEKAVTALEKYVVVEIEMSSGLSDVNVRHSGTPMYKCESKADLDGRTAEVPGYSGFFFYDAAGTLYIKTKNFSPFAISYTAPANYVADVDGVKYGTLAEAVAQVKDAGTSTVKLLADVALTKTIETTKSFTLNLAGYDITAADCRAIWVKSGALTLTGKGTIAANKVDAESEFSASSSVIRVGVSEAAARAELTIGAEVTVSSDYCYGVTVFGKNSPYNILTVNGKIKVTGTASAISGNGSQDLEASGIYINAGAEIYAENDYAIFHPGAGVLTITGGKITGKGGIEAKGGEVFINGGEIMATAPTTSHVVNQNGPSTSGYAIVAVENSGYKGPAAIAVTGGTVLGPIATVKDSEATFDASLSIRGGSYTLNPWKYVAEGYEANYDSATGLWVVSYYEGQHPGAVAKRVMSNGYTTYYTSLQAAINASVEGSRIELLRNVDSTDILFFDNSVVLEGNFHEVTNTANRVFRVRKQNLDISIKNLAITSKCPDDDDVRGISFDTASSGSKLLLDGCSVSASYYVINTVPGADNLEVTIKNGTIAAGWAAINSYSNNSTWTIENSTLRGLNDKGESSWNNFNTITIDGNCLYGGTVGSYGSNNTISISDSTIFASSESENEQYWIGIQYGAQGNTVTATGCSIIDDEGIDQSENYLLGYYYNYHDGQWDYYEPTSTITIK